MIKTTQMIIMIIMTILNLTKMSLLALLIIYRQSNNIEKILYTIVVVQWFQLLLYSLKDGYAEYIIEKLEKANSKSEIKYEKLEEEHRKLRYP